MIVARTIEALRSERRRMGAASVGFVPTMGFLHAGHRSLVERASAECDQSTVSIFVNPAQFGRDEDFEQYPRNEARDIALLEAAGASLLFIPTAAQIYPAGFGTTVQPGSVAHHLEGATRPGHFTGVATVVLKLLNLVQPDRAYFGLKDAQQVAVIQRLVCDLNVPTTIVACDTVRGEDGLALSSRNTYLSSDERTQARAIYRGLCAAQRAFDDGATCTNRLTTAFADVVSTQSLCIIQHATIVDSQTLEPVHDCVTTPSRLIVRVRVGTTFLDDNIALTPLVHAT